MPFVIFMLALAVFAQGTSEFMLAGLLPDIATDLAITVPQAGLLTSAFAVGMIVGAPLMAALGRRWSPRVVLPAFLVVFIVMHAVGALTDSFPLLLATRVLAAVANAGFLAVTLSTVAALVAPDRRARALSVILGGTTLALIAGVPAGAAVGALFDWRAALWGVVIISLPAVIAVIVAVPVRVESPAVRLPTVRISGGLRDELRVLRRPSLLRALALAALVNGATFCAFTYLAPVVTFRVGLADGMVPLVLAIFGIGAFLGVAIAGRCADSFASRLIRGGGIALLAGWVLLAAVVTPPAIFLALVLLQGALSFAVGSTLIAVAMREATSAPTMSGSFATASLNVGAALGPIGGGIAYATVAGAVGPLIVSAFFVLLALLLVATGGRALLSERPGG